MITFESLDVGSLFSDILYISREYGVKFSYQCHWVNVLIRGWLRLR